MTRSDKPHVWLEGRIETPPFSQVARIEAGSLLRRLQRGEKLGLPQSRPVPTIGPRCHELRIQEESVAWRIIYRVDRDAIIILVIFAKKTRQTPKKIIEMSRARLRAYDQLS
jgi:phage-related protein